MVRSGGEAAIDVGEEMPYWESVVQYGYQYGYLVQNRQIQRVGAFLRVRASLLGDGKTVHVILTPEISARVDNETERIKFTALSSEVMVENGATITIGGYGKNQDFYEAFLAGVRKSGQKGNVNITLTVNVL